MPDDSFTSGGRRHRLSVYPASGDSEKHPTILLIHGNFGLAEPYGSQIRGFAADLAELNYITAVPHLYLDDNAHPFDANPHTAILADALAAVTERPDVDPERVGFIGFSLGATTAMTYITENPSGKIKALADFFGFLTLAIRADVERFPPTIIFHNRNDKIVPVANSRELSNLLPASVPHELVEPYDEHWQMVDHAFEPGGAADTDSRARTTRWFLTHLPPNGR